MIQVPTLEFEARRKKEDIGFLDQSRRCAALRAGLARIKRRS